MKLAEIELFRVDLPMVDPLRTSFGTVDIRPILLVKVTTDEAVVGWGECVALGSPAYSSEFRAGAILVIRDFFAPALFSRTDLRASHVSLVLAGFRGHPMAKAALELAVLDAELKSENRSLASHLGGTRTRVESGVSVGIKDSIPQLLDAVENYLTQGYRRIKLKIQPGWDLSPVAEVRRKFGSELRLQVDANAAYRRGDLRHLKRLDAHDLLLLEQPLAEEDLLGHVALAAALDTPVCLDETITSVQTAAQAIELGACSIVNIKPGRVGGYLEAKRIHDLCAAHQVPVWCGGMMESGIGRAANLALASLPNFLLPGDISGSSRYYHEDVTLPIEIGTDGTVAVPNEPGIGREPRAELLDQLAQTSERLLRP